MAPPSAAPAGEDTMPDTGQLWLRDRVFRVKRAQVTRCADAWQIEIDTHDEEYDDELWTPCLYHQGLRLAARTVAELPGSVTSWRSPEEPGYPHPERGFLYVFGHHDVRDCTLAFAAGEHGQVLLSWEGLCDVFWDAEYRENVPFRCRCAVVESGG